MSAHDIIFADSSSDIRRLGEACDGRVRGSGGKFMRTFFMLWSRAQNDSLEATELPEIRLSKDDGSCVEQLSSS